MKIPLFFSRTGPSLFFERKDGTKVKPHHFTTRFDNPTDAVQENGTYGGTKAKPLGVGTLAALLFVAQGNDTRCFNPQAQHRSLARCIP